MTAKALGHRLLQGGLFVYPALFILSACPRLIVPQAKAPVDQGPFGPSLTHIISEPGDLSLQTGAQPCEECHQTQSEDWQSSMHAFSSFNNPFYRFNFDTYVKNKGHDKGVFCAGCHDPALLQSGEIKKPIRPQSKNAHAGINCVACHRIEAATTDGNGSYTLVTHSLLLPQDSDPQSLPKHRDQMGSAKTLGNQLCVSCHRGFLSPITGHDLFIPALEDWKPFRHSGYNRHKATRVDLPTSQNQCISCHMPLKKDESGKTIHDHGFMGGHTAFTAAGMLKKQQEKQQKLIRNSAQLFVPLAGYQNEKGVLLDTSLSWKEAKSIYFDVVVWNKNTGHSFPGGAKDIKDTWLEVRILDAEGHTVAESGSTHDNNPADIDAHRLGVLQVDDNGHPVLSHEVAHFRTAAFDHTIPPRDARVIRYELDLKANHHLKGQTLTAEVKLRHRRLLPSFHQTSCKAAQTPRGRAFLQATKKHNGITIDSCIPPAIMDLQTHQFTWVTPKPTANEPQQTEALWAHGLGMLHALNEKVFLARHSFKLAKTIAQQAQQSEQWQKRLLWGQATVSRLQGRATEAITIYEKALQTNVNHPALLFGIAQTYMKTWRFKEAVPFLEEALKQAPQDSRLAIALSRAYASQQKYKQSLKVAQKGLDIEPRDPHLLRLQTIALEKQFPQSSAAKEARAIFLKYKRDELAPSIQGKCQDNSRFCKRERLGFHSHALHTSQHTPQP